MTGGVAARGIVSEVGSVYDNTPEQQRAAMRTVRRMATSDADQAELIDALGLNGRAMRTAKKGQKAAAIPESTVRDAAINTTTSEGGAS